MITAIPQSTDQPLLNKGIYTTRQAARYARIRPPMMARWIHGSQAGQSAIRPELADDPDRFVTFLDFVQALAIRAIRHDRKLSLQLIREVVRIAERDYNLLYPFARKHTTYLFGNDIVIRIADDTIIQVSGNYKHHQLIKPVVELYADDLVYETGPLPTRFEAFKYEGRTIMIDPAVRFGEPMVMSCNYPVDVLLTAVETEGTAELAAAAYEIDKDDVVAAQRYDDCLLAVAQ